MLASSSEQLLHTESLRLEEGGGNKVAPTAAAAASEEEAAAAEVVRSALRLERQAASLTQEVSALSVQWSAATDDMDHQLATDSRHKHWAILRNVQQQHQAATVTASNMDHTIAELTERLKALEETTSVQDQQRALFLADERSLELKLESLFEQESTLAEQLASLQQEQAFMLASQRSFQQAEANHTEKQRNAFYKKTLAQQQQRQQLQSGSASARASMADVTTLLNSSSSSTPEPWRRSDGFSSKLRVGDITTIKLVGDRPLSWWFPSIGFLVYPAVRTTLASSDFAV